MPVALGKSAQELRDKLGLSLRDAASELGISYVHLCNIENGKASPSPEIIDRFYANWGIDLYMYAIAFHPDERSAPKGIRAPLKALEKSWKRHIESLIEKRNKDGNSCLNSAD